jgi:HAD superfamily hydrolase (TIGR01549 family)
MNTYTHIVFDIDGTLIDTEKAVLVSLQDMLSEVENKYYKPDDLRFALGIPGITALNQLGLKDADKAYHIWNEYLKKHLDAVNVFNGVKELLHELKAKGFELGIITSKNRFEYNQDFIPFGLANFFTTVICMEDSKRPKPFPDPMLSYLNKASANVKEVLYIGDTAYDGECAYSAGADFGLAQWGYKDPRPVEAKFYFRTPSEVIRLLSHKID